MTTVFLKEKKCFVCGTGSRYPETSSAMSFSGPRDLDSRPAEMQRSSVYLWVQRCLSCGYCAPDISVGGDGLKAQVTAEAYVKQLNDPHFPETANSYLCQAMILEEKQDFASAGWALLFAAWVSDDGGKKESSRECRKRAISYFERARQRHQAFAPSRGEEVVILVDLFRRSGQFNAASNLCDIELQAGHDQHILDVLLYEKELIGAVDIRKHTVREAVDAQEK